MEFKENIGVELGKYQTIDKCLPRQIGIIKCLIGGEIIGPLRCVDKPETTTNRQTSTPEIPHAGIGIGSRLGSGSQGSPQCHITDSSCTCSRPLPRLPAIRDPPPRCYMHGIPQSKLKTH